MTKEQLVQKFITNPQAMNAGAGKLSKRFLLSKELIYKAKEEARAHFHAEDVATLSNEVSRLEEIVVKVSNEKGTLESTTTTTFEPQNDLELAKLHKIDLNKYVIKNYWTKLLPNGKFTSSVFCTLKKLEDVKPIDILKVLNDYKPNYLPVIKEDLLNTNFVNKSCAVINITDFHLDKLDIFGTPFQNKVDSFYTLLDKMLYRAYQSNNLEEICFIVGSDFLHTDNYQNSTTKLTNQDISTDWYTSFTTGFDIYVNSINKLKQFCDKLTVVLVAGNHSYTKESYLAFALSKYFQQDTNIHFDISPDSRKVFVYGNTLIGFHHGNCKQEQLPLIFAKEFTSIWGKCKYHTIITGDKHHFSEKDYSGVIVKQLPAVSNPDRWHNSSNYHLAEQSAICVIYDKEMGRSMDIHVKL